MNRVPIYLLLADDDEDDRDLFRDELTELDEFTLPKTVHNGEQLRNILYIEEHIKKSHF